MQGSLGLRDGFLEELEVIALDPALREGSAWLCKEMHRFLGSGADGSAGVAPQRDDQIDDVAEPRRVELAGAIHRLTMA